MTTSDVSLESDTVLVTVHVGSVVGELEVSVHPLAGNQVGDALIVFPKLTGPTASFLMRRAAICPSQIRVVASYTGACTYEVYCRAIQAGLFDARILGSPDWRVSPAEVTTTPALLIPASLNDRAGILVKNWSATRNVYLSHTLAGATSAAGYPLAPRDAISMDLSAGSEIYAVAEGGTAELRIVEAGGT